MSTNENFIKWKQLPKNKDKDWYDYMAETGDVQGAPPLTPKAPITKPTTGRQSTFGGLSSSQVDVGDGTKMTQWNVEPLYSDPQRKQINPTYNTSKIRDVGAGVSYGMESSNGGDVWYRLGSAIGGMVGGLFNKNMAGKMDYLRAQQQADELNKRELAKTEAQQKLEMNSAKYQTIILNANSKTEAAGLRRAIAAARTRDAALKTFRENAPAVYNNRLNAPDGRVWAASSEGIAFRRELVRDGLVLMIGADKANKMSDSELDGYDLNSMADTTVKNVGNFKMVVDKNNEWNMWALLDSQGNPVPSDDAVKDYQKAKLNEGKTDTTRLGEAIAKAQQMADKFGLDKGNKQGKAKWDGLVIKFTDQLLSNGYVDDKITVNGTTRSLKDLIESGKKWDFSQNRPGIAPAASKTENVESKVLDDGEEGTTIDEVPDNILSSDEKNAIKTKLPMDAQQLVAKSYKFGEEGDKALEELSKKGDAYNGLVGSIKADKQKFLGSMPSEEFKTATEAETAEFSQPGDKQSNALANAINSADNYIKWFETYNGGKLSGIDPKDERGPKFVAMANNYFAAITRRDNLENIFKSKYGYTDGDLARLKAEGLKPVILGVKIEGQNPKFGSLAFIKPTSNDSDYYKTIFGIVGDVDAQGNTVTSYDGYYQKVLKAIKAAGPNAGFPGIFAKITSMYPSEEKILKEIAKLMYKIKDRLSIVVGDAKNPEIVYITNIGKEGLKVYNGVTAPNPQQIANTPVEIREIK